MSGQIDFYGTRIIIGAGINVPPLEEWVFMGEVRYTVIVVKFGDQVIAKKQFKTVEEGNEQRAKLLKILDEFEEQTMLRMKVVSIPCNSIE